ncbi:MAG: GGDEF domain-containing protein [Acidobacteriia bacterium]|nr:GGDEF domain-containing protein [Terriglobia bacterium]
MRLRSNSKIWAIAVVCLVIAQAIASMLLPKGYRLTAITDWISLTLMLSAALAFARNAFGSNHRQRLVWILLGVGYAVEAGGQVLWMHWDLVVKKTPAMSLGDACIFLAWTAVIMGFALRPHVEPTPQHQRLGTFDLLLLLLAGLYLYLFLVIPWQYLAPEPQTYGPAYMFLALAEDVILLSIVALGWRHSSGRWRHFYALLTGIVVFDTIMEYIVDTIPNAVAFSGGWYDGATAAGIAGMTLAALMAYRLEPVSEREDPDSERYWRLASRLAAPFTLILPLLAAWSFHDRSVPVPVWQFRVFLSLAAVVVFAAVGIVKQARLETELANANRELLDASLTDLLTGVRNRRFFTSSIETDVQQVLRSFGGYSPTDVRNRDLVFYLIDIDHFKKVNDQFGHKIGDQVLAEVARRINSAARLSDAVIRWGGEEFLLLSRYTDRKEAHILANRILDSVGSKPYHVEASKADLRVTCSLGWAVFPWTESDPKLVSHDQILVLADFALYQAKGSGRNRAVGLLPAGETVRAGTAAPTIYINGIPASPVTTPGPSLEPITAPGPTTPSANTIAASAT